MSVTTIMTTIMMSIVASSDSCDDIIGGCSDDCGDINDGVMITILLKLVMIIRTVMMMTTKNIIIKCEKYELFFLKK